MTPTVDANPGIIKEDAVIDKLKSVASHPVAHRTVKQLVHIAHHKLATQGTCLGGIAYSLMHDHAASAADWMFVILGVLCLLEGIKVED